MSLLTIPPIKTNKCCLLYGPGKAGFENREVPVLEDPHDILVRVSYVGVCGSDVSSSSPWWGTESILISLKRLISGRMAG